MESGHVSSLQNELILNATKVPLIHLISSVSALLQPLVLTTLLISSPSQAPTEQWKDRKRPSLLGMTLAYLLCKTSMIRYYLQIAVLSHCPATDRLWIPPNIPADPSTLLSTLIKHCRPATHRHAGHSHTSSITLGWGGQRCQTTPLSRALGSCLAPPLPRGMEIAWWCHEEGWAVGVSRNQGKLRKNK